MALKKVEKRLSGALTFVKWTQQQQHMQKPTQKVSSLTHKLWSSYKETPKTAPFIKCHNINTFPIVQHALMEALGG